LDHFVTDIQAGRAERRHLPCDHCGTAAARKLFEKGGDTYVRCPSCGLIYIDPQPTDAELTAIYDEHYYDAWGKGVNATHVAQLKRRTFSLMLDRLARALEVRGGRLLDVGCATGYLLEVAQERGFEPFGVELNGFSARQAQEKFGADRIHCGMVEDAPFPRGSFQSIVMSDLLEHVRSPRQLLTRVRDLVAPGGALVVVAPDVGGLSSKLLRSNWTDYKREHLFYFDKRTLAATLTAADFRVREIRSFPKYLDLSYIRQQLMEYPTPLFTTLVRAIHAVAPERATRIAFPIFAGSMMAIALRV
jgi:2-polyprenyl-3-methyl-5-hydroxy-6-metoxy-1,4-benzoquinol methylase